MLIEFSVGNYRSFSQTQRFSMVASKVKSADPLLDERNVISIDGDLRLLKSAAIYGANGSGKSNLTKAMAFVKRFATGSSKETQISDQIEVDRFRLLSDDGKPSFFEFVFMLDGIQHRYGFEVDREQVVTEWLFNVPSTREAKLFERRKNKITIARTFKEGRGLEEKTRSNALFLSVCAQFNGPIAARILNWFSRMNIVSGLNDMGIQQYTIKCIQSPEKKRALLDLIQTLDFRIKDLLVEDEVPLTEETLPRKMPVELKSALIKSGLSSPMSVKTVRTFKRLPSGEIFDLREQESEGTQKLISLAGPLMDTLTAGKVLVVDELDARLHPLITKEIIKLFNSTETNPNGAQLIFTTHDTNLLSNKLFRRDQIWFTELDEDGATQLYSLVEYKMPVRNDASFEKDYVTGRYGAIPFIGDMENIFKN